MRLRLATLADLDLIRRWDEEPHLEGTGGDPEWNDWDWENQLGREVAWREFLIAEVEGRPIGFLQIIDPNEEESHYWGECEPDLRAIDIWIGEAGMIGKGHGRAMMSLAIERCFDTPSVTAILIDPMADNTNAHRFYEALGFKFVERRQFGPDDCLIYRLTRADWRMETENAQSTHR